MLFLIDTADVKEIEKALEVFPLAGVTTSPTIIARAKRDYFAILKDIRSLIGPEKMLHTQVMGTTCEDMIRDAERIHEIMGSENLYIKIPVSAEGYKAMPILKKKGMKITATAIFSPNQALLAARWGVEFTAPYLNRIDNISGMGVTVVNMISQLYRVHNLPTKVLAASFRSVRQVNEIALGGCHSITASPEILWQLLKHPLTDMSLNQFRQDWESVYGEGKSIYDL